MQYWSATLQRNVSIQQLVEALTKKAVAASCKPVFRLDSLSYDYQLRGNEHHVTVSGKVRVIVTGHHRSEMFACCCTFRQHPKTKEWQNERAVLSIEIERRLRRIQDPRSQKRQPRTLCPALQF